MGTINQLRKIEKERIADLINEEYEKNGMHSAIDWAEVYNQEYEAKIPYEWCELCDNHMPSIDHTCCCCGSETNKPTKPKFYKAVLKPIKGNVFDKVYPWLKGDNQLTIAERLGNAEGKCECGHNEWMLLADECVAVKEGGKPYIECLNCGMLTHL
jgi:hypothetical protein